MAYSEAAKILKEKIRRVIRKGSSFINFFSLKNILNCSEGDIANFDFI